MVLVLKKSKVLVLTKTVLVLKNLQGLGLVGDGLNYCTSLVCTKERNRICTNTCNAAAVCLPM